MARHDPQVSFRIPASLKEKLDRAAGENNRTITAELVLRLEQTFSEDETVSELSDRVAKLEDLVDRLCLHSGLLDPYNQPD